MKHSGGKKRRGWITIGLLFALLAGLSLLLYPTISEYWNARHQSRAIADYVEMVSDLDAETNLQMLRQAQAYNQALPRDDTRFLPTEEETEAYNGLLDVTGTGIMGYLEIPSLGVSLPIYHGTDETVLQIALGHIQGTSLPVGGAGTHCVISGHRGLPSAKLLTDLDQLAEGDIFYLEVLGETLTYQVDQIHIVEPEDLTFLAIEEGEDLCTLMTCTPYGVNSHRLLVRGHRIQNEDALSGNYIAADALQIAPKLVALALSSPALLAVLIWALIGRYGKKKT